MKKQILEKKPYSNHPDDKHLSVVLCKWEQSALPYVVWVHNSQDGGYHNGDYCATLKEAVDAFEKRGKVKG